MRVPFLMSRVFISLITIGLRISFKEKGWFLLKRLKIKFFASEEEKGQRFSLIPNFLLVECLTSSFLIE